MKENKLLQRGRYFNSEYFFEEFNPNWNKYDFEKIFAYLNGVYGVKADGSLWICGLNGIGIGEVFNKVTSLGDAVQYTAKEFTKVDVGITGIKKVVSNTNSTIILTNSGELYGAGINYSAELGLGDRNVRHTFVKLSIDNVKDVEISITNNVTVILKNDNTIWGTGNPELGETPKGNIFGLGDDYNIKFSFTKLPIEDVKYIKIVYANLFVIKNDNTLWATGYNLYGQLGIGTTINVSAFTKIGIDNAKEIVGGQNHTMILKNDNTLWGAGYNSNGELGSGNASSVSTFISVLSDVKQVVAGLANTIVVKLDNTVWGAGSKFYLGIGVSGAATNFTKIEDLYNIKCIVSGCGYTFLAITNDNKILFTGKNDNYIIGCKDFSNDYFFNTFSTYKDNDYIGYNKSINVGRDTYLSKDNGDYLIYNKGDKIVCGNNNTFLLKGNGELYGTGHNANGELGLGHSNTVNGFTLITNNVKDVECSSDSTVILKYDGTVWGAGANRLGELGNGNTAKRLTFGKIIVDNVKKIVCGSDHTMILKNDNTLWGAGYNSTGQLGLGHTSSALSFTKIDIDNVKDVSCGRIHTVILKYDGTVWGAGANTNGELGLENKINYTTFTRLNIDNVKQVRAIYQATFILKKDNSLLCTGMNSNGQLGLGHTTSPITVFTKSRTDVAYICKGSPFSVHTLICTTSGVILGTGDNSESQLTSGSESSLSGFTQISPTGKRMRYAVTGNRYTLIVQNDNKVYIRGSNSKGQLGESSSSVVVKGAYATWFINNNVTSFTNNFKIVCSNYGSTFLLTNKNRLYATGKNNYGQLGLGDSSDRNTFTEFSTIYGNVMDIQDISASHDNTIILKTDGTVYGAGTNAFNTLGSGISTGNAPRFMQITDIDKHNIIQISNGISFTLLLTDTGNVYGSGKNDYSELGLAHTNIITKFTKLPINDVKYICAGMTSSYIVKNDGTLWVSGQNSSGQLGLGHNKVVNVFTKVDIDNVKKVITGTNFAFVLKYDGTVWSTGKNANGQLGLGDSSDRNTFTKVNIDNVKKIACGEYHMLILKYDGTVWSAGANASGELGLGHTNIVNQLTQITQYAQIRDIACGDACTIIVLNNGNVLGIGLNNNGQLGLGTASSQPTFANIFKSIFDFDKINSIVTNTNFNLINNQYIIPIKDTFGKYESEYDLDYTKLLGINRPSNNEAIKIPVENIKEFWMSRTHTLVINIDGELYGRGLNTYGQLLNPIETTELTSFTKLNFENVKQASCGTGFSYFVKNDGTLYSIGLNDTYQLGLGHNNEVTEPQIVNISNVKKVMCDHNFTLVLKNDNTLWVQGYNRNGNLGLGANKANQTIVEFTKVAEDIDDVEIGSDYILLRKTDNTVYISGKIRDHYSIVGNDTTIFNKIGIPNFVKTEDLTWVNPMNDDTTVMIYKTHTMNSTIEIMEKTISGFKVKIDDIGNPIIKVEMYINNELITTMSEFTNKVAAFSIPLDKIKLGVNNVVFKGYDDYANNMYASAIINKENNAMCVTENSNLLINEKRYTVKSITDTENKITVTLDRELEGNINVGDIIYQLINNLKVQIKTNNTGMHKDAKLLEIKKVDTGYQEIYEFKEDGIKEVEPKIVVNGNENTAIKRPSMIFSIDESTL